MTVTIGLVANIFQEANALPGWLETHTSYFDDVRVYHAGPQGEFSTDGTLDILARWNIPMVFGKIDEGFGVVRTKAIRYSPCDYVMILDADERFFPVHRIMTCTGESTPQREVDAILQSYDFHDLRTVLPNWENMARLGAKLQVDSTAVYDQGAQLRDILNEKRPDAIATIRRHWHDLSFRRPTQNWHTDPDWQMRLVRNDPSIYFDSTVRVHERLVGAGHVIRSDGKFGPFFDHFHLFFKRMEIEQRAHDVKIYDRIHEGRTPPTYKEFNS